MLDLRRSPGSRALPLGLRGVEAAQTVVGSLHLPVVAVEVVAVAAEVAVAAVAGVVAAGVVAEVAAGVVQEVVQEEVAEVAD